MNRFFGVLFFCLIAALLPAHNVLAQSIKSPDEEELFERDLSDSEKAEAAKVKQALSVDAPSTDNLDFKAPNVEFLKDKNVIKGSGGAVISQAGTISQSDQAEVNLTTKDSTLQGKVIVSTSTASLSADNSKFNFDSETGTFNKAKVLLEEGGYIAESEKLDKLSETKYNLFDTMFTTCHCADGKRPWKINSGSADITQEGYAHCYNNTIEFQGVPILYTPYLAFPVKTERQSGLLVPTYGFSSEDGFQYKQPIFAVIDDSSDATISPFTETHTRYGSQLDFRQYFSKRSKVDARLIYSNETPRDGDLRGANVDDLFDKEIEDNRFLGYFNQRWQNEQGADVPLQFLSDIHLTNDDLAIREFDDDKIAEDNANYLTSQMVFRAGLTDYLTASLEGEYNQFITSDDDLGFQRLPELNITELKSFRPFGYNALGARLVTRTQMSVTQFQRDEGYDGLRTNIVPNVSIPFHVQNYVASEVGVGMRYTTYNLDNTLNPGYDSTVEGSLQNLDESDDRQVFNVYYGMSTALENVYGLDDDSWLTYITNLGKENQVNRLRRVKHTVEPFMRYNFVPPTAQDQLPNFDSTDRIRQKSTVTYGFTSNLYGRFLPLSGSTEKITELTPRIEELPDLNTIGAAPDIGSLEAYRGLGGAVSSRSGEIRNLASLTMKQVYDYTEDHKDNDPARSPYSDVDSDLTFYPTPDFALSIQNYYNAEDHDSSYWALASHIRDDRGDNLKLRYTYRDDDPNTDTVQTSQIEGNLELVFSEQLRYAIYANYDEEESEIIKERMALRLVSSCNCWSIDLGYGKKENPDKEYVFLGFTLAGLGDVSQKFGLTSTDSQ